MGMILGQAITYNLTFTLVCVFYGAIVVSNAGLIRGQGLLFKTTVCIFTIPGGLVAVLVPTHLLDLLFVAVVSPFLGEMAFLIGLTLLHIISAAGMTVIAVSLTRYLFKQMAKPAAN